MYIENPQLNATMSHVAHIVRQVDGGAVLGAARLDTFQYGYGPFERLYETADGWICIATLEEGEINALARVVGVEVGQAGFELGLGAANGLADELAARIEGQDTATWLATFEAAGVPAVKPVDTATRTPS